MKDYKTFEQGEERNGGEDFFRSVSVVIPTLNAEKELEELLRGLEKQTRAPGEILVIDSGSEDQTKKIAGRHERVRIQEIPREQFNHGGTRHRAFSLTTGEIVVFMTQDAVPANERLLERLTAPLREEKTVASYARQIPKADASPRERLVRAFNYPEKSERHTKEDIPAKGIKTFFLSDVCAGYRRKEYEELGGFETDLRSNEDMLYAAGAIRNGYAVAYAADAEVRHSHNLTLKEQYRRNRLQGYEIERHRDLLGNTSSTGEGIAMLKEAAGGLLKQGRLLSIAGLIADCAARYLGSRAGKREYRKDVKASEKNARTLRT